MNQKELLDAVSDHFQTHNIEIDYIHKEKKNIAYADFIIPTASRNFPVQLSMNFTSNIFLLDIDLNISPGRYKKNVHNTLMCLNEINSFFTQFKFTCPLLGNIKLSSSFSIGQEDNAVDKIHSTTKYMIICINKFHDHLTFVTSGKMNYYEFIRLVKRELTCFNL